MDSLFVKLIRFYPNVLYATKSQVGFVIAGNQRKSGLGCPKPPGEIIDIVTELASNHIFYVLLENGEILVYDISY